MYSLIEYQESVKKPNSLSFIELQVYILYYLNKYAKAVTFQSTLSDLARYQLSTNPSSYWKAIDYLTNQNFLESQKVQKNKIGNKTKECFLRLNLNPNETQLVTDIANLWPVIIRRCCPRNYYLSFSSDLSEYASKELMCYCYQENLQLEGDVFLNIAESAYRFLSDPTPNSQWATAFKDITSKNYCWIYSHFQKILDQERIVVL